MPSNLGLLRLGPTLLLGFAILASAHQTRAQYMFLDLDGDGVYTSGDTFPASAPSTIDVYLVTEIEDGTPITCSEGADLYVNSYTVNLYAYDAAVSFTSVTNQMPGMSEVVPLTTYPYALSVGYGGPQSFPPGKHHLLRITVDFEVGCPMLDIVSHSCYSPPGVVTSFGSPSCTGARGDNAFRFGEDWWPAIAFMCTDLAGRWPTLTCPDAVSGVEGQPLTIPVTLADPDCGIFSFWVYDLPSGAAFSGLGPFVAGEASGAVSWTPAIGQAGKYAIHAHASDYPNAFHGITQLDTYTIRVTIAPAPTLSAERDLSARVFTTGHNAVTRVARGGAQTCFQIEPPPDGPFALQDILPASVSVRYDDPRCGPSEAPAMGTAAQSTDTDGNGIPEFESCFPQSAMESLASCLPPGTNTVRLELHGSLVNGDHFHGELLHTIISAVRGLSVEVSPNPTNTKSVFRFTTSAEGLATVRLFNLRGAPVLTLVDRRSIPAGVHSYQLDRLGGLGGRLASGVYFLKVSTEHDGSVTRALTIMR